jgi:hypothetical protein
MSFPEHVVRGPYRGFAGAAGGAVLHASRAGVGMGMGYDELPPVSLPPCSQDGGAMTSAESYRIAALPSWAWAGSVRGM